MDNVIKTLSDFWANHGPWITASLIPTIIVGLSMVPQLKPAAGYVEKGWAFFLKVMEFLSVVSHKNKPGTFKLPLNLHLVVAKVKAKKELDNNPGLVLIFVVLLSSTQVSCTWFRSAGKEAKSTAINCTIESVRENASHLVPAIVGILSGGTVNWKDQIKLFIKEFGRDATACAVRVAMQKITAPVMSEPTVDPEVAAREAAARAAELEQSQNWTFTE